MELARFSLENYKFTYVEMNLEGAKPDSTFDIDFIPSGVYKESDSSFLLSFVFKASTADDATDVITIKCLAKYIFKNVASIDDIPAFFYNNAIAILFPYVRAFVSTVTLQANINPLILPTLNLSDLQEKLKNNTTTAK